MSVSFHCVSTCADYRAVAVALNVEYTDSYPDSLPNFSIEVQRGDLDEDEIKQLLGELAKVVRPFCVAPRTPPPSSTSGEIREKKIWAWP